MKKMKGKWFQILMWGLCVVLGIGLVFMIRIDRKRTVQHMAELQQQASVQEQESGEKLEALAALYDETISDLKVDSFVCWGDGEMVGKKDSSFPEALKQTISDNLSAPLKKIFGNAIKNGEHDTLDVSITNMGVANEGMRQILARAGVTDIELREWVQIPGDTDPVVLWLTDDGDWPGEDEELRFAKQDHVSFGKVWISDIEGTLVTVEDWYDSNHPRYAFVRDEEGRSYGYGAGTVIKIESASQYLGDIPIFFFSDKNVRSVGSFVSNIEDLVYRYAGSDDDEDELTYDLPFVVICTVAEGSELDEALQEAFGSRYIRNDSYVNEMNNKSYASLAQQVYENLDQQGCFDSVKDRIARAVQEADGL